MSFCQRDVNGADETSKSTTRVAQFPGARTLDRSGARLTPRFPPAPRSGRRRSSLSARGAPPPLALARGLGSRLASLRPLARAAGALLSVLAGPHPRSLSLGGSAHASLPSGPSLEPQALDRPAAFGFAAGVGHQPLPAVDVGEHVVAEWRVLGGGTGVESLFREADRLVEMPPLIEVELGEIEVTLRESRIQLDRFSVGRLLPRRVPHLLAQFAQVERRLEGARLGVDLLLVLRRRRLQVAARLRDQRQIEVRERNVGLLRQRRANLLFRAADIAAPQGHDTQRVA